jgi:hypothetical protein
MSSTTFSRLTKRLSLHDAWAHAQHRERQRIDAGGYNIAQVHDHIRQIVSGAVTIRAPAHDFCDVRGVDPTLKHQPCPDYLDMLCVRHDIPSLARIADAHGVKERRVVAPIRNECNVSPTESCRWRGSRRSRFSYVDDALNALGYQVYVVDEATTSALRRAGLVLCGESHS